MKVDAQCGNYHPVQGPKEARDVLLTATEEFREVSWSKTGGASFGEGLLFRKRARDGKESAQALIDGISKGCVDCCSARPNAGKLQGC